MAVVHGSDTETSGDLGRRFSLFAVTFAAAVLFHLAGNPPAGFLPPNALLIVVQVVLGALALAVLLLPSRRTAACTALCVGVLISAWLEAPFIGNHWVLAAAIALAYLLAVAAAPRRGDHPWALFAPAARWTLLIAYAFAGFAKLNSDFFNPDVSCAVYYHHQLVSSWGAGFLSAAGRPLLGMAAAVGAAAVELSIPLLLLVRRTRRAGVLLALSFHWLLALDLFQHFWDFSSVLFAAFLLFLDDEQVRLVTQRAEAWRDAVRPAVRRLGPPAVAVLAAVATSAVVPQPRLLRVLAVFAGHAAWIAAGTILLLLVAAATVRGRASRQGVRLRVAPGALAVVPALVLFNGLTPYLELKTGFGWNMYSNLRTVNGDSNHLLVPATWNLTGLQSDQVQILEASDPALAELIGTDRTVAYSELREYAHTYPDASVTYRRGDATFDAPRLADDPAGRGGVSVISARLQSFRAIDTAADERCLAAYTPAR